MAVKRLGPSTLSRLASYIRKNAEAMGLTECPNENFIKDAVHGMFFGGEWLDYECCLTGQGLRVTLLLKLRAEFVAFEEKDFATMIINNLLPTVYPEQYLERDTVRKRDRRSTISHKIYPLT